MLEITVYQIFTNIALLFPFKIHFSPGGNFLIRLSKHKMRHILPNDIMFIDLWITISYLHTCIMHTLLCRI